MTFSTIINNPFCKCGCGKVKTLGYQGYNMGCRPDIKADRLKKHKKKSTLSREIHSIRKIATEDGNKELADNYSKLQGYTR